MLGVNLPHARMIRIVFIALLAVVLWVDVGWGTISVNWESGQLNDPGAPGSPIHDTSLALLLWSPDAIMDPIDFAQPGAATGNDTILYTAGLGDLDSGFIVVSGPLTFRGEDNPGTPPVGDLNPAGTYAVSDGLVGGWVFTRVFNAADPGISDWYAQGGMVFMEDQDPSIGAGPGPQTINITGSLGTSLELDTQVVPEPMSVALVVVALSSLGFRWRHKESLSL